MSHSGHWLNSIGFVYFTFQDRFHSYYGTMGIQVQICRERKPTLLLKHKTCQKSHHFQLWQLYYFCPNQSKYQSIWIGPPFVLAMLDGWHFELETMSRSLSVVGRRNPGS